MNRQLHKKKKKTHLTGNRWSNCIAALIAITPRQQWKGEAYADILYTPIFVPHFMFFLSSILFTERLKDDCSWNQGDVLAVVLQTEASFRIVLCRPGLAHTLLQTCSLMQLFCFLASIPRHLIFRLLLFPLVVAVLFSLRVVVVLLLLPFACVFSLFLIYSLHV